MYIIQDTMSLCIVWYGPSTLYWKSRSMWYLETERTEASERSERVWGGTVTWIEEIFYFLFSMLLLIGSVWTAIELAISWGGDMIETLKQSYLQRRRWLRVQSVVVRLQLALSIILLILVILWKKSEHICKSVWISVVYLRVGFPDCNSVLGRIFPS